MKAQILYARYEPETAQEEAASKILTEGNLAVIRTLLAMEVQRRLALSPDSNNYAKFIQEEAEIKGAITAYQTLLDAHVDTIESLNAEKLATSQSILS